ncbi:MAG: type VI secretion system baseplate subunit TssF [Desulfovibrio sp.]|nr:type VI secretion system baseplate subunit TssF [Desulfovibrio sp.]
MVTTRYYQRELEYLRVLAAEFARAHPAVAPLLSGPSSDPDVERLLEGTAYLAGQMMRKLDEGYDSIAENLCSLVLPQLLRDIPSCTVTVFRPKVALSEILVLPKGTRTASVEIDGVSCIFSTAYPVELAPLLLAGVKTESSPGKQAGLRFDFTMTFPPALRDIRRLRLFLRGQRVDAVRRLYFLVRNTERVILEIGGNRRSLPGSALSPVGFAPEDALIPYPATAWPGYRLLQEYYIFPEKFFFLDIALPDSGTDDKGAPAFSCTLEFKRPLPDDIPSFALDDFALFATPAVNLFPYETTPVKADYRQESYPIRANSSKSGAYVPYQITEVRGIDPDAPDKERACLPLLAAVRDRTAPSYMTVYEKTETGGREMRLALVPPHGSPVPAPEMFSMRVLYSNGELPGRLNIGDIREALSTSPGLAGFTNLIPPTKPAPAPAEGNVLWSLLAHLQLNYLPLADAQTARALLSAYLPGKTDTLYSGANAKRIDSILSLDVQQTDYLWKGRPVRGSDILITLDEAGFSNIGDMHLFGTVLAAFLHEYSPINSFVRVTAVDSHNKYKFQWLKHREMHAPK